MKKNHFALIVLYLVFSSGVVSAKVADIDMEKYRQSHSLYQSYCARCHGKNADGRAKIAAYYRKISAPKPANFTIPLIKNRRNREISRFGQELSDYQIDALVYFIKTTAEYGMQFRSIE